MMTGPVLLRADGLRRHFDGVAAVDGITLTLRAGDRHALVGPNGAGKTTVLNLLAGTLRPTAGRIHWLGRDITRRGPVYRARAGIGRSFQTPTVMPSLSTLDNLVLGAWARTRRPWWPAARLRRLRVEAMATLARVDLAPLAGAPAAALSHGQRRLLDIAMAMSGRPSLLLLDEPAAGLDGADDLRRLLDLLGALPHDMAVVLVEHHLDVVAAVATTVTELDHGRVVHHAAG